MSYYKTKKAVLKKNGKVSVTVAANNTYPLHWFTQEYPGTLSEFLESVNEGNFHLYNNRDTEQIRNAAETVERLMKCFEKETDIDSSVSFKYGLTTFNKARRYLCDQCAERILNGYAENTHDFGIRVGHKLNDYIEIAKEELERVKAEDKENGIIRINCAACSIFEGLDLLYPEDSNDGYILAPDKDYKSGKLQTAPGNIISLGKMSGDLYAFLSFNGIGFSLEEYIEKNPYMEQKAYEKFGLVDIVVGRAINEGARLKKGVVPYEGYCASYPVAV